MNLALYIEQLIKGKWENIRPVKSLTKKEIEQILDLWNDTYVYRGKMYDSEVSMEEFLSEEGTKAVLIVDKDSIDDIDAFIIYKDTEFGNKISFLGSKPSIKNFLIKKLVELLKTDFWFVEASENIEELLKRRKDVQPITDYDVIKKIIYKKINTLENGYYERIVTGSNKNIVKRIYGRIKIT